METRIRKLRDITSAIKPGPGSAGIWVDSDNKLKYSSSASGTDTTFIVDAVAGVTKGEVVTATNVLTADESGKVFFLNSATEFVSTLPLPALGLNYRFVVSAAPSGASYTVVTTSSANIIKGQMLTSQDAGGSADSETSGGDTVSFVDGKAVAGDWAYFVSDGTTWFVTAGTKVFDAVTITTAS